MKQEESDEELPSRLQTAILYISILGNLLISIFPLKTFIVFKL